MNARRLGWVGVGAAVAALGACNHPDKETARERNDRTGVGSTTSGSGGGAPPSADVALEVLPAAGSGTGGVYLDPDPPGGVYRRGATVRLEARPDTGSSFRGWGGDLAGETRHVFELTLDRDTTLEPVFERPPAGSPVADFTVGPEATGAAPLTVRLEEQSTGGAARFAWDLGDGQTASGADVDHVYTRPGRYTVVLRVFDAAGVEGLEVVRREAVVVVDPSEGSRYWYEGDQYGNPVKQNDANEAALAQQVLDLINAERASAGLPPLQAGADMARAAKAHSADMAARGYFAHPTPEGWSVDDRLRVAGVTGQSAVAENIAAGPTADAVVQGWLNSPPHRANILGAFTHTGVGVARASSGQLLWTQVFGAR